MDTAYFEVVDLVCSTAVYYIVYVQVNHTQSTHADTMCVCVQNSGTRASVLLVSQTLMNAVTEDSNSRSATDMKLT
jgi:hypothetical protein